MIPEVSQERDLNGIEDSGLSAAGWRVCFASQSGGSAGVGAEKTPAGDYSIDTHWGGSSEVSKTPRLGTEQINKPTFPRESHVGFLQRRPSSPGRGVAREGAPYDLIRPAPVIDR
jgi:hypothetical protein